MSKETTIISGPQSGRTGLITMLGKIFEDAYGDYNLAERFSNYGFGKDIKNLGDYNLHTFPREHEDQAGTKTPEEILTNKTYLNDMYGRGNKIPAKDVNVIFLTRHPMDALVSNYNRRMKIKNPATNFRGTPSEFIRAEKGSLKSMIKWWNTGAKEKHKCNDFILVKYEEMHTLPYTVLKNLLNFIGYGNIEDKYIDQAIEFGQIENMRKIEQKEGNQHHTMFSKNINFVGDGKMGKGETFFNKEDQKYIMDMVNKYLHPFFGYNK